MTKKVLVYGTGGHASVAIDILKLSKISIIGMVEDVDKTLYQKKIHDIKVLGDLEFCFKKFKKNNTVFVIAIGSNQIREEIHQKIESKGYEIISIRHPSAIISKTAHLEAGSLICAGAYVGPYSKIGRSTIINSMASVDHHCQVGDFAHIAPGAILGGSVHVGVRTLVGLGSKIKNNITIGNDVILGLGSSVIQNLPSKIMAYGTPAEQIKELE